MIEFFPYKLVRKEGLNSLQAEGEMNQLLKTGGERLLTKLLIRSIFSRRTLSLNSSSLSFEDKGLEWQFLDWKVIILIVFFNVRILLIAFEF